MKRYEYTEIRGESQSRYYQFELWFRDEQGRGFHVGLIHSELQAQKICDALNQSGTTEAE